MSRFTIFSLLFISIFLSSCVLTLEEAKKQFVSKKVYKVDQIKTVSILDSFDKRIKGNNEVGTKNSTDIVGLQEFADSKADALQGIRYKWSPQIIKLWTSVTGSPKMCISIRVNMLTGSGTYIEKTGNADNVSFNTQSFSARNPSLSKDKREWQCSISGNPTGEYSLEKDGKRVKAQKQGEPAISQR